MENTNNSTICVDAMVEVCWSGSQTENTNSSATPKRVAIVGFSSTSRKLAPYDDLSVEVWTVNQAYEIPDIKRITRLFDTHPYVDLRRLSHRMRSRNNALGTHWNWLTQDHGFPIYMQQFTPLVPNCIRYPLEEVIDDLYGEPYFASGPAYLLGLAIHEKFDEIGLYGVEMMTGSEYEYQKPNMEYLIGIARGRGIKIILPENCTLCRADMYGYENDQRIVDNTFLIGRKALLDSELRKAEAQLNVAQGMFDALTVFRDNAIKGDGNLAPLLETAIKEAGEELETKLRRYNQITGGLDEVTFLDEWHREQNVPGTRKGMTTASTIEVKNEAQPKSS